MSSGSPSHQSLADRNQQLSEAFSVPEGRLTPAGTNLRVPANCIMEGEGAIGQWEMNWDFDNALKTADKHSFFKFMPKPTVNSYNRTHIMRVPGPGRFEVRLPDGAVNPYLLQPIIIAAALSGARAETDPGKRHGIDMYADGHKVHGAPKLPLNWARPSQAPI